MKKSLLLSIVAIGAATSLSHGQLVVNEPFNYATGGLGSTAVTGTGLSGNWGGTITAGAISGTAGGTVINTFTYTPPTGYGPAPSANQLSTNNVASYAALSSSIATNVDSTNYMSFFIRLSADGLTSNSFFNVGLVNTGTGNVDFLNFGKSSSNANFGMKLGTGAFAASGVAITADTDYFVTMKLSILGSGTDSLQFKIYTSADTLPVSEPVTWDQTYTGSLTDTFTGIGFRSGSAQTLLSDEFRLGTTWAAVTAVPEPSTYALIGAGMLALALLRKRRQQA